MNNEEMLEKIKHNRVTLPYPHSEYEKLTEKEQLDWRWRDKF
jgi:hypothetical protein